MSADPPMSDEPEEASSDAPEERQTTPFLVLQFFIFPMAIVAVCVTVFVLFGLIASEHKTARDYLAEIRSGNSNTRWQAAYALSTLVQGGDPKAFADPRFVPEALDLFEHSGNDDPRVRRYLAVSLGRLGDPRAVRVLARFLEQADSDTDSESQIYATWALGALSDPSVVPLLTKLAKSPDKGIRKTAVHSLAPFPGPTVDAALREALTDATEDVRWNAALALARRKDPSALPVLLQMLDRAHLALVDGLTAEQRQEALLEAIPAAGELGGSSVAATLGALAENDPDLKVREGARETLQKLPR
jgi:HEAT repeat protein